MKMPIKNILSPGKCIVSFKRNLRGKKMNESRFICQQYADTRLPFEDLKWLQDLVCFIALL